LHGGAVDAIGAVQERDVAAAEREALDKPGVRQLGAVLRLEDVESGEARGTNVVVAHPPIL
jgi:hypothetical protein